MIPGCTDSTPTPTDPESKSLADSFRNSACMNCWVIHTLFYQPTAPQHWHQELMFPAEENHPLAPTLEPTALASIQGRGLFKCTISALYLLSQYAKKFSIHLLSAVSVRKTCKTPTDSNLSSNPGAVGGYTASSPYENYLL